MRGTMRSVIAPACVHSCKPAPHKPDAGGEPVVVVRGKLWQWQHHANASYLPRHEKLRRKVALEARGRLSARDGGGSVPEGQPTRGERLA